MTAASRKPDWVVSGGGPLQPLAECDLGGRPGFKMALHVAGGRRFLYVAHLWHRGWTIVDVTDPEHPHVVRFVEGPANTWTCQVTIHGGLMATGLERIPGGWGGEPDQPFEQGILLWDLTDPTDPKRVGAFTTDGGGVHRSIFDDEGNLHVAARLAGYAGAIYVALDLNDPSRPREIARFHMPGQHSAGGEHTDREWADLHGPPLRLDGKVFLPYAGLGLVTLAWPQPQSDWRPTGHLDVHPPLGSGIAVHTVVPLPSRNLAIINSEALAERCDEPVNYAGLVDISDVRTMHLVSLFPTPEPPKGYVAESFCARGGRFGPHNQHIPYGDGNLYQSDEICFLTYFNAGLRVYDISNKHHVHEVAHLIPKDPPRRHGPLPSDLVVQVEDVLVDDRGIVFFTEKNSNLYVAHWKA